MASLENSMEYEAIHIPDVTETFKTVIKEAPRFVSLLSVADYKATNHTHEWLEHVRERSSWSVNGTSATSSTTLVLDDTTGIEVNDILKFEKPSGGSTSVKAKVTAIVSGTNLTITRLGTDEAILDNSVVYLVARPRPENSDETLADNDKPEREYNYTQIFRRDFTLSETTLETKVYGLATRAERQNKVMELVNFQALGKLTDIARELNQSLIDGYREKRSESASNQNGMMGGLLYFLEQNSESVYDAGGNDVSQGILNNAVAQAGNNGAATEQMTVMLCHTDQARAISQFNTSGNNPIVVRGEVTAGSYVAQYQTDLAGTNGGALTVVVVDRNFPKDKIAIINPSDVKIVPMRSLRVEETTTGKTDGRTFKIIGELTAEFKNAATDHVLIENLGIPTFE